ncbi:MAG TPA: Ig-like domain-containing protein, partial [Marmoricola sp.]|nr:Ig-like domain-containing protein [Marmoricola sp.]
MRRLTAAVAALTTAAGLSLVGLSAAQATITSPANGSTVAGTISLSDSGATDSSSLCITGGSSPQTEVRVFNSANTAVFDQTKAGTGAASFNWDTHSVPNGAYKVQADERNKKGTLICSNSSATVTSNITVTNTVDLGFTGALSAPQNTTVPLAVTVTDPNNVNAAVNGLTVTASLSGQTATGSAVSAGGVANISLPISAPPRSGATLTLTFAGTANWAAKTVTKSFDVTKNGTATTVTAPAAVVHGQATSFSASVAATNGTGTPDGTIQFTVDGTNFCSPVAVSGTGTANSGSTSTLSTGDHTIGAVYSGSSNYLTSSASTQTQTVHKADTITSLSDNPAGSTVSGQAVTFTAHVDIVSPGVGTLGGAVQFNIDGQPFGTAVSLGAGDNAILTVSNLSVANHNVVAVYNGNDDFASSSSATVTHGVGKADTTVAVTSSDATAFSGEPLNFTAQVNPVGPGAGSPTGTVQFSADGVNIGDPVTVSPSGQAVSPTTSLPVKSNFGSYTILANYSGDANFSGEQGTVTQSIAPAQTTTSISSNPNPSVHGQAFTVHAEVTPNAPATGHPTGTIRFVVDGASYGFVDMTNGAADLTINGLTTGDHTIKAVYLSDDLNFFTSTSDTITQTINKASTKTTLASDSANSVFGQPVTFTATVAPVAPGAGTPSGTIVFKDGSTVVGTQPVSSSTGEQASITLSNLSVGSHALSATYSGDDDFNGSAGNVSQTVTRAHTSLALASSANPAASGQGVQFTATVTPVAPGTGSPTGTVKFFVNGANLGGAVPVAADGTASSANFASLSPGTYTITATYSGDGNFVGTDGVLDQGTGQNITKGTTTSTVTSGPSPSAYGDPVTVTTTVVGGAPAAGKPTGLVQIYEGDVLLGSTPLAQQSAANTSVATFVTTSLAAGEHSLTAVYVGNFNFGGSTGSASQTVGQESTVTGISSSGSPAVYGDTVTFTATVNAATGTPTGTVTFKEGSTVLGTAPVASVGGNRQASLAVAGLHAGSHNVTAAYSGDTSFGAST